MSEPTPLSTVAADIAELVERYRDDSLTADERDQVAQRLATDPFFRTEFRTHLRLAQTLAVSLDRDPIASAGRADLALAALSSSHRLAVWRAVTAQLDAGTRRHQTWWRWAAAGAAAALLPVALLPWAVRGNGQPIALTMAGVSTSETTRPQKQETPLGRPTVAPPVSERAPVNVAILAPPASTEVAHRESVIVTAPVLPDVGSLPSVPVAEVALVAPPRVPLRVAAPATTVVASVRGVGDQERAELPERGAWLAGGASVRRGAREIPPKGLLALVPGDDIEVGNLETTVQPDDGIRLVCAPYSRLVVSPTTGRRQVGRYVALISGAITSAEIASGETLIVATDHGEVIAAGARLDVSLHDGWLRCAVHDGSAKVGPQHRRIDAGAVAVLAGGRVLTVYAPGRTGAAVLGGGWTRRGAPWFPLIAQSSARTPAALASLAGHGFDAVIVPSVNDARAAVQAGLGVILELTPTILAQVSALHTQPGLLAWSAPHDGSPRRQQEALRTIASLRRSDIGHAVLTRAGDGDTGRRLAAAADGLVTSNPALFGGHAPLARVAVSDDPVAMRLRAYADLTEGARGLLVVNPLTQSAAVRGLLTEISHVAPLLAIGERDVLTTPAGIFAARWSDGHDTLLVAVNPSDNPVTIPAVGNWTNGLHLLTAERTDAAEATVSETGLAAGVLTIPAHSVCVLVTGAY